MSPKASTALSYVQEGTAFGVKTYGRDGLTVRKCQLAQNLLNEKGLFNCGSFATT